MAKTNDRTAVQNAATNERAQRKAELDSVRFLMSTPLGRSLAARLLDACGVDRRTPFQPNAMVLAHDHGTQEMGYYLLDEIREACPEAELVMRKESLVRAQRADLNQEVEDGQRTESDE